MGVSWVHCGASPGVMSAMSRLPTHSRVTPSRSSQGSSPMNTLTRITYVSGVRQQVLLQRAAHPHEPPLRPDPVGQVAHVESASGAPVGRRSAAWLSHPAHSLSFSLSLSHCLDFRTSLPTRRRYSPPPPHHHHQPRVADTLTGTSHS